MASAVAAINAMVAGVGIVILLVAILGGDAIGIAVAVGAALVVLLMVLAVAYQIRRYEQMVAGRR